MGISYWTQSRAATLTWTGAAGNGSIFSSGNWNPAQVPVTGDALIFSGTSSLAADAGSTALTVATLNFDATAGAFVLNGTNTLKLTAAGGITTSSRTAETLNPNILLGIAQTWTSNTSGNLVINGSVANGGYLLTLAGAGLTTINGIISGSGGLTKSSTGVGTLQLNGANTYAGNTSLGSGLTQIGNNSALGTGILTFASSTTKIEAIGGPRTLANNYVFGSTLNVQGANDITLNGSGSFTATRKIYINGTGIFTLNGAISGTGTLTKYGTGTLALAGANTHTGGVSLAAGTLIAANSGVFGAGAISLGSGTLQTAGNALTLANTVSLGGNTIFAGSQNITFSGNATLTGSRTLTNNSTGTVTYNGAISGGAYYFYKKGTGTFAFGGTAANTFTGLTNIYDGGLLLGKTAGVNAVAGALRIGDGVGAVGSAWTQLNASNQIIDTSALTMYGDGELRLLSNNETIGSLTTYGGSITGSGTLGLGGNVTFTSSGTTPATIAANLALNAARTFSIADNPNVAIDMSVSGVISDGASSSAITKTGSGTIDLTGANTFSGGLNVNAGVLQAGANTALGTTAVNLGDTTGTATAGLLFDTSSGLAISNAITARTGSSGTLTLGGLNTSGVNIFAGAITLARSISLTAAAGGEVDLNGAISGAGGITKIGAGIVKLNSANTHSGATVINAGTLLLGASNALGAGAVTVTAGTLDLGSNHSATVGAITLTSGSLLGTGTSTLTSGAAMSVSSGTISLNLAGTGGLTKSTTGDVVVSGANIFTGTSSITAGSFTAGAANAFSASSAVTVSTGATLALQNFNNTIASLAGAGSVTLGSATLTTGGNNTSTTFTGVLSGSGGLTKTGTGVLALGATNTYSGTTTINGGTLRFAVNNAINANSAVTLASGSVLDLANFTGSFGSIAGAGNITQGSGALSFGGDNSSTTFSGALSGTGGITKDGTGTTTLTGASTTTGGTILSNGKIVLSGATGVLATTSITIRTGATLELNNTVAENGNRLADNAAITLNGGSLRLLSDSNGTLESAGLLTIASGASALEVVHNGNLLTNTRLTFTSLGSIASGANVNFTGTGGTLGDAFGPQIYITGQANGLLGSWATVGADPAEYSTFGIRAYGDYYEGIIGLNYNSTAKIVRLSASTLSAAFTLTNSAQTTDLGLNLTNIATVDLGSDSSRTLNLLGGSLIKSTATDTVINGSGVLTAGGSSSASLAISVNPGSSLTIASVIANNSGGTVGLIKSDSGALTLSGANTFTGNVTLNGGTTNISTEANLGAAGNDVTFGGGTLHLTGSFTSSSGKSFSIISSQSGSIDIDAAQTLTLSNTSGALQTGNAAATLIKTGAGTLIVQNANTAFTGTLQVNQGRAELRNAQSLAGSVALNGGTLALVANTSTSFGNTLNILSSSTVQVDRLSGTGAVTHSLGTVNLGASTWTISGANAASLTVGAVNLAGAGIFNPTTADLTTGAIGGSQNLTKSGAGVLTVNGVSTYTGATLVNTGTLRLGVADALPTTTDLTVSSGAGFDLAGFNATTNSLSGAGSVTLGGGTLNTGSNTSSFTGIISGSGGLTKTGNGTLTLTSQSTYTGATNINSGTLFLGGANLLPTSTNLTVAGGATLLLNGNNTAAASLSGAGIVVLGAGSFTTGSSSSTFSGTLSGLGGFIKTGAGTFTISGGSTYSGATSLNAGSVIVRNSAALGDVSGGIVLASGAELQLENDIALGKALTTSGTLRNNSGANIYSGNVTLGGNSTITADAGSIEISGDLALAGNTLTVSGSADSTILGVISGAGSITKSGAGTLIFGDDNTYSGVTSVSSGTLQIASASALGSTAAGTTVAGGATLLIDEAVGGLNVAAEALSLSGSGTLRSNAGQNTWNGNISLGANSSIQVDADTLTLAGNVTESGGSRTLIKTGAGTLLIDGLASQTGGTNITGGNLQLNSSDRLFQSGALVISSGATFDLDDNDQTIGALSGSGSIQIGVSATSSGGGTLTVGSGDADATFSGSIAGAGDLEKTGAGTQTLAAATTFTGTTTIHSGRLEVSANNALGATNAIEVNSGGTLLLSGSSATNRINNAVSITLDGGTLARTTGSEGSATSRSSTGVLTGSSTVGLGVLTLTANSTIDFGNGAFGTLSFAGLVTNGFTLNILNYSRNLSGASLDNANDRLIFDESQSSNLARFNFGSGFTATQNSLGNGYYEVTVAPVPEPSTWLGAMGISSMAVVRLIRQRRRLIRPVAAGLR
ncbi:MAG: autotransporter-associated beta strand repeat-containing protein [Chthoniobacterales bacterium]